MSEYTDSSQCEYCGRVSTEYEGIHSQKNRSTSRGTFRYATTAYNHYIFVGTWPLTHILIHGNSKEDILNKVGPNV
jgi:hypothetical protein